MLRHRHPWVGDNQDRRPVCAERITAGQAEDRREITRLRDEQLRDTRQLDSARRTLSAFQEQSDVLTDTISAIARELGQRSPAGTDSTVARTQTAEPTAAAAATVTDVRQAHQAYEQLHLTGPHVDPPQV